MTINLETVFTQASEALNKQVRSTVAEILVGETKDGLVAEAIHNKVVEIVERSEVGAREIQRVFEAGFEEALHEHRVLTKDDFDPEECITRDEYDFDNFVTRDDFDPDNVCTLDDARSEFVSRDEFDPDEFVEVDEFKVLSRRVDALERTLGAFAKLATSPALRAVLVALGASETVLDDLAVTAEAAE